MWTDSINAADAAPSQVVDVPANETEIVRAYVTVPPGTRPDEFDFVVTSLDEQGETDVQATTFTGPGGE